MEEVSEIHRDMEETIEILKKENSYMKSRIEGLSDLLWSMGARTISPFYDELITWFNTPVPAFDNRVPLEILRTDGEIKLYEWMKTIPC